MRNDHNPHEKWEIISVGFAAMLFFLGIGGCMKLAGCKTVNGTPTINAAP